MSRRWKVVLALAAITPAQAMAQSTNNVNDADRAIAEKMMSASGRITPDKSRSSCFRTVKKGEIVVCAPEGDDQHVPSTSESDPMGAGTRDGSLRPPDVSGLPDCSQGKQSGCIGFGRVPPPVYMIDLKSIPLAPAGSDADKIANGEMRAP